VTDDIGLLYVLANRDSSLAKIGITRNGSPDARATDYERAHGITWSVFWQARTENVAEAEARAHRELRDYRFVNAVGAKEVFHVTPEAAVAVAQRYVVPPDSESPAQTARPLWHWRIERIAAAALVIIACWPAARRLTRRARSLAREFQHLLRP
jgi:T5orf172 domain